MPQTLLAKKKTKYAWIVLLKSYFKTNSAPIHNHTPNFADHFRTLLGKSKFHGNPWKHPAIYKIVNTAPPLNELISKWRPYSLKMSL